MSFAILLSVLAAGSAPVASAPTETPLAEKRICRRLPSTGSNIVKRECHTKAEWDAMAAHGQNALDKNRSVNSEMGRGSWQRTGSD